MNKTNFIMVAILLIILNFIYFMGIYLNSLFLMTFAGANALSSFTIFIIELFLKERKKKNGD